MQKGGMEISVFQYPVEGGSVPPPAWEDLAELEPAATIQGARNDQEDRDKAKAHSDLLSDQLRQSFDAGFAAGREAGAREVRAAVESESETRRDADQHERLRQMAGLVERFDAERARYVQAVEREVVALALAVAARILRREAQMDSLLLTGAVRVALGQLSESTEVKLRVPGADAALWREAIAHLPNLAVRPEVVAVDEMRLGDCVLETRLGSVDLGVRAQLGEIEHGFFDRAQRGAGRRAARQDNYAMPQDLNAEQETAQA